MDQYWDAHDLPVSTLGSHYFDKKLNHMSDYSVTKVLACCRIKLLPRVLVLVFPETYDQGGIMSNQYM